MERPFALWALLFAILPWLAFLRPPRSEVARVPFPALVLLSSSKSRKRRSRRAFFRAALRSLALAALAILWASPTFLDDDAHVTASRAPAGAEQSLDSILIVDGAVVDPERSPGDGATFSSAQILELALAAQFDDVKIERVAALDFSLRPSKTLEPRDVALVVDVSALTPPEETALAEFAKRGGAVVFWPGVATDAARWNATFRRWNVAAQIVDSPLEDAPGSARSSEERKFLKAFPGAESANLDALPAERAILCVGADVVPILRDGKTRAPVFARLANGLYWFAFSPDPRCSALAAAPAFPALVEATTRYSLSAPRGAASNDAKGALSWRGAAKTAIWLVPFVAAVVEVAPLRRRARRLPLKGVKKRL